ncbi:MAG: elongation factor-1 alpha [Gammaproteobacteria bacterium]|nr:elongation factor-1 alpha [Gammaproteobacteria bacterium]
MNTSNNNWLNLPSIGLPIRVLFTGYLVAIGLGLLMAGGQILLTHGMADGKLGLSVDDVVYSYYGNRNNSRLETALNGAMKDKATDAVRADIISWARDGAPQTLWDKKFKQVFANNCIACHGTVPGIPNFNHYEEVKQVAQIDEGSSVDSLTRVSHIHLFGIAFIFFFVGLIFSMSVGIPRWLKALVIALPFAFLVIDVLSWWLTKWHPGFAWLTIIGGAGYTLASAFMWVTSIYQMWFMPRSPSQSYVNEWQHD